MKARKINHLANDFLSLIYPNLCFCCDAPLVKQETIICSKCMVGMPRSHFHLVKGNPVEQLFWGRVIIEKATAYYIFQKGSRYQRLLHFLKYKGFKQIGIEMGKRFGAETSQTNFFDDIDCIAPVPLHKRKEKKRGYNQSLLIAQGMSQTLKAPVIQDNLYRTQYTATQTRKGRYERWQNVSNLFALKNKESLSGKHVLLVDDVVTTGSTLEACAQTILNCDNTKVSLATLAFAAL